ncbi:MAG: RNA-directed DNA polymerase [Elusimicrobiota bacterium]
MDKNIVYTKLLCFGLFPEKLDGIFVSEKFGKWIKNNKSINIPFNDRFSLLSYKLTRNNNSPRQMGIPHPLGYFRLVREILNNWVKIEKLFQPVFYKEKSMVCPKTGNRNLRLVSLKSYDKDPGEEQLQLDKQFGNKYLVHADISSCFPSIYTHSISWALVGKKTAKKNQRDHNIWYNKIDKTCQYLQDGETRGIPIGADTSTILCEIILSKIDQALKKYNYIRFIDDYTCSCKTKEEADKFIRDLSKYLEDYKLCLNVKKTKILEYPKAINEDWVRKLRMAVDWQSIGKKEKDSVIGFLDLSSELFEKNPNESSIRYATQILKKKKYKDYSIYKLVLRYFLNLSFLFPYILDTCDELISRGINSFRSNNSDIKAIIEEAFTKILEEHTKYRRSDVITWSMFLAIKYDLSIQNFSRIEKDIVKTKDPIPSLMAYLYKKIRKENIVSYKSMVSKVDENEWWLFSYEICRIEKIALRNTEMEKARRAKITFLSSEITSKL